MIFEFESDILEAFVEDDTVRDHVQCLDIKFLI